MIINGFNNDEDNSLTDLQSVDFTTLFDILYKGLSALTKSNKILYVVPQPVQSQEKLRVAFAQFDFSYFGEAAHILRIMLFTLIDYTINPLVIDVFQDHTQRREWRKVWHQQLTAGDKGEWSSLEESQKAFLIYERCRFRANNLFAVLLSISLFQNFLEDLPDETFKQKLLEASKKANLLINEFAGNASSQYSTIIQPQESYTMSPYNERSLAEKVQLVFKVDALVLKVLNIFWPNLSLINATSFDICRQLLFLLNLPTPNNLIQETLLQDHQVF